MATRRLSGIATSSSVPDNGGDHSGGGGSAGGASDDVFSTYVYTGTGGDQDIKNGIDLAGKGGMVWTKDRDNSRDHALFDTERGTNRYLNSNQEYVETQSGTITSYNDDGFSLLGNAAVNGSGIDYVSWSFRKAPKFFDVVTYTGDGVAGREIPHNLGVKPGMIIVKCTSDAGSWVVYHQDLGGSNYYIYLNSTAGRSNNSQMWNSGPTDSVFRVGNGTDVNSAHGKEYVAYLFAHDDSDESMIKCGSFPGRYSTIDLGFEPQWVLMKPATSDGPWTMLDTMRGWTAQESVGSSPLRANENSAEIQGDTSLGYITSTGFYVGNVGTANHIYMAIRRPTKHASEFEPEELFAMDPASDGSSPPTFTSGFPVDFYIHRQPITSTSNWQTGSRLTQGKRLYINLTDAETSDPDGYFDYQGGYSNAAGASNYHGYMWRRAPGFFDVVAYTGNGTGQDIPHNLGVAPEMMWIKRRNYDYRWTVYYPEATNQGTLELNTDAARGLNPTTWDNTAPTATHFTVGTDVSVNHTHPYIAYLFASVPGISKIGSFTGNGTNQDIDCGFTNGARFVLIKRTDDTGDWCVFDTSLGIYSSDAPFLKLNETDAVTTGYNNLSPYSGGFNVLWAGADLNRAGAEYIYYAIA